VATLQQVIQLVFEGVDNASQTATSVSKSLEDLGKAATDISQPFKDIAEQVLIVQTVLIALGGVIGTLAYKEAVEFESSLLDLQKQMDENDGSARDYSGTLEQLALKYGINANELVKSAADFKAAGYDLKTSTDLVEQSLKLVIAGGLDAATSVGVMNRALAGFDIQASDVINSAQKIGDILNKTADITKSSFGELATGFADLSPIAKLTGLSFEETAAILSKVIDVFGSGSEAANALKSGLLAIVDPSDKAAAELARLGVKFNEAGKPIGTIKDILAIIGPQFEKMDQASRLAAAGIIFSSDQAAKMVTVLGRYSGAMELADRITREATGSI
jgi:TP901 family phage tail tape measure protein